MTPDIATKPLRTQGQKDRDMLVLLLLQAVLTGALCSLQTPSMALLVAAGLLAGAGLLISRFSPGAASRWALSTAVIAQVPHVSGIASVLQVPPLISLKLSLAAVFDLLGSLVGRPVYSRIVGYPGQAAAMSSEEAWDGFMRLIPSGLSWKNRVLSRVFLELPFYSPIRHVARIQAPTLVIAGQYDSLTPAACAQRAAQRIRRSEFHLLACNHFEPYVGRVFEKNIALQLDFLKRTLCGRAQPPEPQPGP